jgi:hypothetical protein
MPFELPTLILLITANIELVLGAVWILNHIVEVHDEILETEGSIDQTALESTRLLAELTSMENL